MLRQVLSNKLVFRSQDGFLSGRSQYVRIWFESFALCNENSILHNLNCHKPYSEFAFTLFSLLGYLQLLELSLIFCVFCVSHYLGVYITFSSCDKSVYIKYFCFLFLSAWCLEILFCIISNSMSVDLVATNPYPLAWPVIYATHCITLSVLDLLETSTIP